MKRKKVDKQKMTAVLITAALILSNSAGCASRMQSGAPSPMGNKGAVHTATTAAAMEAGGAMKSGENISAQARDSSEVVSNYKSAYTQEEYNTEEYKSIVESGFLSTVKNPLSTFSADVDTASYSNIRRMIEDGSGSSQGSIPQDAVRIEEMINYFRYSYPEPEEGKPFSVTTELSDCPWNPESQLLLVGLKAKEIDFDNRPMSNLVFLLDVSGSMYSEDKLPLVQKSFALLTEELTENDRVSIVTYAGYDEVVLEGAMGDEKEKITDALMSLTAGGSTAGSAGIKTAYDLADEYFIPGGNNRVILATDGDLNVGITSEGELKKLIGQKKESGVHLSVLGFGTGNIKDNKMVALADNGDGNYRYIDSLLEAKKVLVEEMGGTLITVAKDVKFQVEFNPGTVRGYRLIGYEKRELADEDFNNDKVDAGEIGSGHNVTVLYELLPVGSGQSVEEPKLKYQTEPETEANTETAGKEEELLTVNIRYKAPNGQESKLLSYPVESGIYQKKMPDNLQFASAVAEFGMVLRDSQWKGSSSFESVLDLASGAAINDTYREEFVKLVEMAKKQFEN